MIIEILGKFFDNHSLSIVNRNLAKALAEIGATIQIVATDAPNKDNITEDYVSLLKDLMKPKGVPDIQLRHTYPPNWSWPQHDKTKVVYIQPWEFQKVPFEWQYKFETFADALITPSDYTAKVFAQGGLNPSKLYSIHNGYDPEVFNKNSLEPSVYVSQEKFTFLFVGNGQWRKGLDILLNSWPKAFVKADNVELVIKDNPNIYGKNNILNEIVKLQYKTGCASIRYIDAQLSQKEMVRLYSTSDVLVHPYRAEGFGMHIQEAVACGCCPLISKNGPSDEFIPDSIGYKIETVSRPINIDDPKVFAIKPGDSTTLMGSHTFINEPHPSSLLNGLRALYHTHNRKKYFDKLDNFELTNTWSSIAQEYISVLEEINTRKVRRHQC